jgi:hypothetical protein
MYVYWREKRRKEVRETYTLQVNTRDRNKSFGGNVSLNQRLVFFTSFYFPLWLKIPLLLLSPLSDLLIGLLLIEKIRIISMFFPSLLIASRMPKSLPIIQG